MADGITVDILGNIALLNNMKAFGVETAAKAQAMLGKAGNTALALADPRTPVDTGYLKSRNQLIVRPGVVTVSNDAPYAIPVALGHRTRGNTFVPPNDWLTPSMMEAGQELAKDLEGLVP